MQRDSEIVAEYRPEMDGKAHEQTYDGFTHFTVVGVIAVVCIVVGLALGGVKHAWLSALVMVILTLISTAVGLFSESISWRAPGAVLAVMMLMMLLY